MTRKSTSGTTFIYGLVDPRTEIIRYVGKANDPLVRLTAHCACKKTITRRERWVESLRKDGLIPEIVILEECQSDEWADKERHWITALRGEGTDLTNLTAGGEGTENMDPEACARRIASITASWTDPDVRARKIEALRKGHRTEEARAKHGDASRANWANPICAAQMRASAKAVWGDPELRLRERAAESQRAAWVGEERRAARCEAIKRGMAASGAAAKISATKRAMNAKQQEEKA